jgi:hypothetical protein
MTWPKGVKRGPQTAEHVAKRAAAMQGPTICSQPECGKRVLARGLCSMHYSRQYNHGTLAAPSPQVAWNKGKKTGLAPWRGKIRGPHSAETKAKMSAAKLGKPKTPEHAANILAGRWHGPKPTYRGVQMRSSYEVRFAKVCDATETLWEYEPRRFNLGTCSYLPDFYLPALGIYVEVKGYFSEESQQKVALFRSLHPEFPLVVVMQETLQHMEGLQHGSPGVEDHLKVSSRGNARL